MGTRTLRTPDIKHKAEILEGSNDISIDVNVVTIKYMGITRNTIQQQVYGVDTRHEASFCTS